MSRLRERLSSLPPLSMPSDTIPTNIPDRKDGLKSAYMMTSATNANNIEYYPFRRMSTTYSPISPISSPILSPNNSISLTSIHSSSTPISPHTKLPRRRFTLTLRHPQSLSFTPIRSNSVTNDDTFVSPTPLGNETISTKSCTFNKNHENEDDGETWSFLCSPSSATARVRIAWPPAVGDSDDKNLTRTPSISSSKKSPPIKSSIISTPHMEGMNMKYSSKIQTLSKSHSHSPTLISNFSRTTSSSVSVSSDEEYDHDLDTPLNMPTPTLDSSPIMNFISPVIVDPNSNQTDFHHHNSIQETISLAENMSLKSRQLDNILGIPRVSTREIRRPPTPYPPHDLDLDHDQDYNEQDNE